MELERGLLRFKLFLSTPSARRATHPIFAGATTLPNFYPRPPRGGRPASISSMMGSKSFLSTPSARRATRGGQRPHRHPDYFYPRPPRGGRLDDLVHALTNNGFLSTPSARRATFSVDHISQGNDISIQALREEGDRGLCALIGSSSNFYPRPPRGGRPHNQALCGDSGQFLSTPSARRATSEMRRPVAMHRHFYPRPPRGGRRHGPPQDAAGRVISIHALREEGDCRHPDPSGADRKFLSTPSARRATSVIRWRAVQPPDFYPRPPRGGRLRVDDIRVIADTISIHALCEEGDIDYVLDIQPGETFLSTPSARRATWQAGSAQVQLRYFYPRPLRGGRPVAFPLGIVLRSISIHALCEEGDVIRAPLPPKLVDFYPRPLRGGRLSAPLF